MLRPPGIAFSGEVESPYQGLFAFGEQDAAFFFGREAAAAEILGRLSGLVDGPALLVVSGASGAGKSSLLQAGVLPRISEAGLTSGPQDLRWPHVVLSPARAPLTELSGRLAPLASRDAASCGWRSGPIRPGSRSPRWRPQAGGRLAPAAAGTALARR